MDVLILSGFLGSGKTSMILAMVDRIKERKRVAIVVNDFGKTGIDGKVMEKRGLRVKEIASGCICCTLVSDLLTTMKSIVESFSPDLIVIEPSGIADPGAIRSLLKDHTGPAVASMTTAVLVDATRYKTIFRAVEKLIRSQLRAADLIIVNKMDAVTPDVLLEIEKTIRDLGVETRIITASAETGANLEEAIEAMVK